MLLCSVWLVKKTLQNQIDEGFSKIQLQIKQTLQGILKTIIEEENPRSSKPHLEELLEKKRNGKILKKTALEIVNVIYVVDNPKRGEIIDKINKLANANLKSKRLINKFQRKGT